MGLDAVEFILAIEQEFGITIPDLDAEKLRTIALLQTYLVQRLAQAASTEDLWRRIERILIDQHGVEPDKVRPQASFVDDLGFS